MAKIKIHEIAKELGLVSKEVVTRAQELGIEVTSHMSAVDEEQAEKIKNSFKTQDTKAGKNEKVKEKNEKVAKNNENDKKKAEKQTPVIIRREVIRADFEEKEEKKEQQKNTRNDVGFVERRKNQDYNIVYRKQPVKPMTVSELFGLKTPQKEEKKEEVKTETVVEETKKPEVKVTKPETTEVQENLKQNQKEEVIERKPQVTDANNKSQSANNRQNNYNRNYENRQNRPFDRNNRQNGNYENRQGNYQNRNNRPYRDNNRQGGYQNRDGQKTFNRNNGPLDNRKIDRNIKDIMANDMMGKEDKRDISTRAIDKEKANRYEDNKAKKGTRAKKGDRFNEEFNEGKLKDLKQVDRLSNMFNDQEGGMLDYYDLTTASGKRAKRKPQKDEERTKQKIFELKEITIPEMITVKDLAQEMKKTSSEVITKLFNYGIMATINNTIDFDTAFLVAEEFGITANKKEEVKEEDILFDETEDKEDELEPRPPICCVIPPASPSIT